MEYIDNKLLKRIGNSTIVLISVFLIVSSGCIEYYQNEITSYPVISVSRGEYLISGDEFYSVTYITEDNEIITKNLDSSDLLHVYASNESKLVITNHGLGRYNLYLNVSEESNEMIQRGK